MLTTEAQLCGYATSQKEPKFRIREIDAAQQHDHPARVRRERVRNRRQPASRISHEQADQGPILATFLLYVGTQLTVP